MKTFTEYSCSKTNKTATGDHLHVNRWIRQISGGMALSLCLGLLSATQAIAASFSFTKIADNRTNFQSFSREVAINDSGTVAFAPVLGQRQQAVYTSNGGLITEVVNSNVLPPLFNNSNPSVPNAVFNNLGSVYLNNNGNLAFIAQAALNSREVETSIITSIDGSLTNRASGISASIAGGEASFVDYALNDIDELVYTIRLSQPITGLQNDRLVLSRTNQPNINVATASIQPTDSPFASINAVAINNQSELIFAATRRDGTTAIFTYSGDSFNTLVETNASSLDINDNGDVVLSNGDAIRLFNRANGVLTTIADTSGIFSSLRSPAINNNGNVAFAATLDLGGTGIFTNADSTIDKVIATGDPLNGSTVTSVNFLPQGFNNNSQIAFFAQLADGTQGIFRADLITHPDAKSVPEGANAFGLMAFALLARASRLNQKQ
ncbi:DUF7453 family protein [Iningainema tapete]|uniref:Uncharacterized protein n=1 Tax=Iningainema tapete BLCC-T55 TaxID=2748662 RepID=A0A8J7C8J2_9CYAN|nr:choice-of-anchor tandem repeat NxxGxxAF-containing protein [Iningainema tapete]MBD2776864.1 hypothetical protein [Iningainema tapete BLCC-T55]